MAKITNLIGTTWRLGADNLYGITAGYGVFYIDGSYTIYSDEEIVIGAQVIGGIAPGYYNSGLVPFDDLVETSDAIAFGSPYEDVLLYFSGTAGPSPNDYILLSIDGGTDISNTLFIDFINTYGTLVSGGEPSVPTAESVVAKIIKSDEISKTLITASNAKTGKTDTNLTDAVNTLLEGYGQGGGGECSGNHIIEVDELPTEGVEGAIYGIPTFSDVYMVMGNQKMLIGQSVLGKCAFDTVTTTTLETSEINVGISTNWCDYALYYLTDIPDIYIAENGLTIGAQSIGAEFGGLSFKGEITDIANATEDGYYAYKGKLTLYQYRDGAYVRMNEQGKLIFISNGDGTCYVDWLTANPYWDIVIPSISPSGDTVTKIDESAFRAATMIKRITIPNTIKEIRFYAFWYCELLTSIIFGGTVEQWNVITKEDNWIGGVKATKVICTDGSVTL